VIALTALAIGLFGLGAPPQASASFVLALQEDGGPITTVFTGSSFNPVTASVTFGNFNYTFFSATAFDGTGGSNLMTSTTQVSSLSVDTHTLTMWVSNQDYTLPADTLLSVRSGMGGTYGASPNFTAGATFQMWADANNGLLTTPVPFTNGLQTAIPASGNSVTFDTGVDPAGIFTRLAGPYSVTTAVSITATGLGDMNYATHVRLAAVPEPGLLLIGLMGSGLLGLFIGVRRWS
jgi:hypothetical protein